jgi:inner membrane protein
VDSLSQIVLGAAVGEVMLGKRIGNKAQLLGAIAGTIPDLDVFMTMASTDPFAGLVLHRGYSHSMFAHILLALPFAWLTWIGFKKNIDFKKWYIFWYLGFFTHTILDCFTTFGTQLLLPFTDYQVGFNNIAVVDPFWTLPFMLLLLICLFIRRDKPARLKFAWAGIGWAALYMGMTFFNKYAVHQHFAKELSRQGIAFENLATSPSIFNNFLWSAIARKGDSLYVGEYSWLQSRDEVKWQRYAANTQLLRNWGDPRAARILEWFGQGKCMIDPVGDELHVFILKWGRGDFTKTELKETFPFYWRLYKENGEYKAEEIQPDWGKEEFNDALNKLIRRTWTADDY